MTLAYKVKSDTSPTRLLTSDDLNDGLQMCSGNQKVDTSFMNLLFKLVRFEFLYFKCQSLNAKMYYIFNRISTRADCLPIRKYFIDENNDRPACTCLVISSENEIACEDIEDELMSSTNVTLNERPYKDIVVLKNGTRFSLTDNHTECFHGKDNYNFFNMAVK